MERAKAYALPVVVAVAAAVVEAGAASKPASIRSETAKSGPLLGGVVGRGGWGCVVFAPFMPSQLASRMTSASSPRESPQIRSRASCSLRLSSCDSRIV